MMSNFTELEEKKKKAAILDRGDVDIPYFVQIFVALLWNAAWGSPCLHLDF